MLEYDEGDTAMTDDHKARKSLSIVLVFLGFASITLYLGSTLLYPLLDFQGFLGLSAREGINKALIDRYVGYLPLLIFGALPVIAGNWLYAKKQVDNTVLATLFIGLFIGFLIVISQII
ncbi:MAG: hypothetical protein HMLIMOIP_000010 [Candidatus Nitrosomirales archaeon]|jgi:hypothetical protein